MLGRTRTALLLIPALLAGGCVTTIGSRTVPRARFDYNEAISRSWNQQMLLNLVRLRYRDTPQFLELSSVLTQYEFAGEVSGGTTVQFDGGVDSVGLSGGVSYVERPTVSYEPLQGEAFARRILAPLAPETIMLLSQSGWRADRLMLCCVQQVNDLFNAPSAAGPTPDRAPRYEAFQEASRLLRELQGDGRLRVATRKVADAGNETVLLVPDDGTPEANRLRETLGLAAGRTEYSVTTTNLDRQPSEVALVGRSLMGTLFFLSQAVEPPPEHVARGKVTVTLDDAGQPFDWSRVVGPILRIRSQASPPDDAFVAIHYRDHWFYIDDADLNSKTTFGLLKYLFSLQSTSGGRSPLLTVSAGG